MKGTWVISLVVGALAGLGSASATAQTTISADGVVESTSGGFMFPDGTVQTTAAVAGSAPVADTGFDESQCWDEDGVSRNCTGTGEDGEFQAGVAWPTPRFTDNLDGTVTDNLTGLMWLQDANCPGIDKTWQGALDWVDDLNTTAIACTNYTPMTFADWRLANLKELRSLADYGEVPAMPSSHPFVNVQSAQFQLYWSSSSTVTVPANAWVMSLYNGGDTTANKVTSGPFVWPVRSGQ